MTLETITNDPRVASVTPMPKGAFSITFSPGWAEQIEDGCPYHTMRCRSLDGALFVMKFVKPCGCDACRGDGAGVAK